MFDSRLEVEETVITLSSMDTQFKHISTILNVSTVYLVIMYFYVFAYLSKQLISAGFCSMSPPPPPPPPHTQHVTLLEMKNT